jgi:gas vesicle protein
MLFGMILYCYYVNQKPTIMDNKTKIILGVAGGIAAAAIVGMIVAPDKMSRLRSQIKDKATGLVEDLDCLLGDVKDQLSGAVQKAEKHVGSIKVKH